MTLHQMGEPWEKDLGGLCPYRVPWGPIPPVVAPLGIDVHAHFFPERFLRAIKGFSYYLRGVEVLEHSPSGARGNFDRDFADSVVKADPTKFRLVPPSQYRTTD